MTKNRTLLINILLFVATAVCNIAYTINVCFGNNIVTLKAITSTLFVVIGIVNIYAIKSLEGNIKFSAILLAGLTFAFLGDVMLEIHFIMGAILFAIGHIFYLISYTILSKLKWQDLLAGSIIFVPITLLILFAPFFTFDSILMQIVCVIYAIIISLMVGKSITNLIYKRTTLNILLMIGSLLFMFSDLILLLNKFGTMNRIVGIVLCLGTYYPAQCVLAYSITHATNKESNKN